MKKLLLLISLFSSCGTAALAQGGQTYWTPGVPTSSTSFAPTFRFNGTDSLAKVYLSNSNRWSQIYTATQTNKILSDTLTPFNNYMVLKNANGNLTYLPGVIYNKTGTVLNSGVHIQQTGEWDGLGNNFMPNLAIDTPGTGGIVRMKLSGGKLFKDTTTYAALYGSGNWLNYLLARSNTWTNSNTFTGNVQMSGDGTYTTLIGGYHFANNEFILPSGGDIRFNNSDKFSDGSPGDVALYFASTGGTLNFSPANHGTISDALGNQFLKGNNAYSSETVGVLPDSTSFSTYTGPAIMVKLLDTLVGGNSLFVLGLKGSNKANGVTMYAAHSPDSLFYRQYDPVNGIMLSWGGAKADGVRYTNTGTDNSPIVQQILNEFPYRQGVFKFDKNGTYKFSEPIEPGQNTIIEGIPGVLPYQVSSGDTIWYYQQNIYCRGNINFIRASTTVSYRSQGCDFRDLNVISDGVGTNNSAAFLGRINPTISPLQTTGLWNFYNVNTDGFGRGWDGTNSADSWYLDKCTANHGHKGIVTGPVGGNVISRGDFYAQDSTGVVLTGRGDVLLSGNQVEVCYNGVAITGYGESVTNSYFTGITNIGIEFQYTSSATKSFANDNYIEASGGASIKVDSGVSDFGVYHNRIYHAGETVPASSAIWARKTVRGSIVDNIITNPGTDGTIAIREDTCNALFTGVNLISGWGTNYQITGAVSPLTVDYYTNIVFHSTTTAVTPASNANNTSVQTTAGSKLINYIPVSFVPTTGATVTLVNHEWNIINPSGTLATLTFVMPTSPVNGDVVNLKFTQTITSATWPASVKDGPPSVTQNTHLIYVYNSADSSWY